VKEYWIVDPDAGTITVLLRGEGSFEVGGIYGEGQSLRSPTLAGFSVTLAEIF
jgi:Uma2 family endonuclease